MIKETGAPWSAWLCDEEGYLSGMMWMISMMGYQSFVRSLVMWVVEFGTAGRLDT